MSKNLLSTPLPEWAPHERLWIGFPAIRAEWGAAFDGARAQIAGFANAIADGGRGETVTVVCNSTEDAAVARDRLEGVVETIVEPLGDVWLRDTAPIITGTGDARRAADFAFNGWGGKYLMPGDADIGARLAGRYGFARDPHAVAGQAVPFLRFADDVSKLDRERNDYLFFLVPAGLLCLPLVVLLVQGARALMVRTRG